MVVSLRQSYVCSCCGDLTPYVTQKNGLLCFSCLAVVLLREQLGARKAEDRHCEFWSEKGQLIPLTFPSPPKKGLP